MNTGRLLGKEDSGASGVTSYAVQSQISMDLCFQILPSHMLGPDVISFIILQQLMGDVHEQTSE